ncbi:MAG: polyribonucleotide nucleotidyltransferase [Bernardetiaceae bacterium]
MQPTAITKTITLPDGRQITLETGKLAKQADGSVVVRMGKTMLLATVVSSHDAREGVDFLPLSVDYQEKFASAGKIPGGFFKREARLSEYEILICRLVDRALRPLFPDDYHAETQVMISLISADDEVMPDALAALAASAAIVISDIPFGGPISEVRVIKHGEDYLINPTPAQMAEATLNMIVAGTMDNIMMVEGELKEAQEEEMLAAIQVAHEAIKVQCQVQQELEAAVGKTQKRTYSHETNDEALQEKIFADLYDAVYAAVSDTSADKKARKAAFDQIKNDYIEALPEDHGYDLGLVAKYFGKLKKKASRDWTLNEGVRIDGRRYDEVRPIWMELDYLPAAHGSAVFTRGETQSLTTVTLGTKMDEQLIDGAMISGTTKYLLHYNFPAFSTGEARPNRGTSRREVGHGNLALRALRYVLPDEKEYPYTVRIVSDILESNGSSSMATVCAGSLALMDAGVPVKSAVSGIAMGMIADPETGKTAILSDILGDEDHLGDMDFKVTGTANGLTACQMDIKIDGLSYELLGKALHQAKEGRLHILGLMNENISESRADYKPHTPRSLTLRIPKNMIGAVIGPGGKIIQEIQAKTGTTLVIEEIPEAGLVNIFSPDKTKLDAAFKWVSEIVAEPEIGQTYTGIVKSIKEFGAFVEFMRGKEGLLHISEIKWEHIESMDGIMEEGEEIQVKLTDIDPKTGKFRLSRKVLLPRPEGYVERRPTPPRSGSNGRSGGGRNDRRPPRRN